MRSIRIWGAAIVFGLLLVGFGHVPILRAIAAFLIVEDILEPAAAIVALGGDPPFREMEAAKLYRAGWAPRVVVVRGVDREESKALKTLGIALTEPWAVSREVLLRLGVSPSAIVISTDEAGGTLEELQAVDSILRTDSGPVILVTSKYHTRRTRLTWQYVSASRLRAIVRTAGNDPFDSTRWWRERRFVLSVVREYLGLVNYYAGFPVATGGSQKASVREQTLALDFRAPTSDLW